MKKVLLTTILSMMLILSLTGCSKQNEFDIGNQSGVVTTDDKVSLSIKDGTLTETGATLILKNKSDKNFQYGNPYEIEIKKDGEWHKINVELNFTLPAFILGAMESKEIELDWQNGYGKLAPGEYRIIKEISFENDNGTFDKFGVSVEFTI